MDPAAPSIDLPVPREVPAPPPPEAAPGTPPPPFIPPGDVDDVDGVLD